MLTDRQSIFLCTLSVIGFVVFGILDILNHFYTAGPIIVLFLIVIINLIITKREPEEKEDNIKEEKKKKNT